MTTTTRAFTVKFDADAELNGQDAWDVVDADGDVVESFPTKIKALIEARDRSQEAEAEALKEEIEGALYDGLDLETLRQIAALLKGR